MSEFDVYKRLGVEVVSAEGLTITLADGRELLDFYGGHAVCVLGHSHPALVGALTRQMGAVLFQTNLVDLAVRREACRRLAAFAPAGLEKVFMVNSGAEANENALRLAFRCRPGATRVVALEGGFHGRTAAAGAASWNHDGWYGFPAAPFEVTTVPREDEAALAAAVGPDVAAVIAEPVLGFAGAIALSRDFLGAIRRACDEHGALFIADEVQCGMGRVGRPFAVTDSGVTPDILTTAKGLGGGFPCAAVIARAAHADRLGKGELGTTFGGGPLAAAAVTAVLDVLEAPGFLAAAAARGRAIRETCRVGPVVDTQGDGLLIGLRVNRPAAEVVAALRARGILAGGAGDPEVVRLMPPLTLDDAAVDALRAALEDIGP